MALSGAVNQSMTDLHYNEKPVENMDADEAAAELLARKLTGPGKIIDVGVQGNVVAFTTKDDGYHLGNVYDDYDADVHLVCEPSAVDWRYSPSMGHMGSEDDTVSEDATVFCNIHVRGVKETGEGYGFPTHTPTRSTAKQKDIEDIPKRIIGLANVAGINLE